MNAVEKKKRKDCFQIAQAPKKTDTFFISYLAYEKNQRHRGAGGEEDAVEGIGTWWAQCKDSLVWNLPEGLG